MTNKAKLVSMINKGGGGKVARVLATDKDTLNKMAAMGVFAGVRIKVIQCFPAFLLQIGQSQFAVDKALAARIEVYEEPLASRK